MDNRPADAHGAIRSSGAGERPPAAMERIGAKFDRIQRKHMLLPDGTRRDTGLVRDHWRRVPDGEAATGQAAALSPWRIPTPTPQAPWLLKVRSM